MGGHRMLPEGLSGALAGLSRRGYYQGGPGLALVYPADTYQYPRGSHASRATIITERDCCQLVAVRYEFPRYLGWPRLLGRRMGAYLFSTITSFPLCSRYPHVVL